MKAENTVMSDEQLDEIGYPILPVGDRTGYRRVAQAQAELTWEKAYKAGVEVAAKWVTENIAFANIPVSWKEWRGQLKIWGIE